MPGKHISFSESLLGFGSYLLKALDGGPKPLDDLWTVYRADFDAGRYSARFSFDTFVLAIVFLYTVGVVQEVEEGVIGKCA